MHDLSSSSIDALPREIEGTPDQSGTTPHIVTFGCRLNTYESEVIRSLVEKAGISDTIVINTCAVTQEAERQARQTIRKLHKAYPHKKIIVTGCSAQINPNQYLKMDEVSQVIGNHEKMHQSTYTLTPPEKERIVLGDIMAVRETASHLVSGFEGKARAFVQIQNGCNHNCTFCTIPLGRGRSRSVPIGHIVDQIRSLVASDYAEIVLTGVDITDYGLDLPGTPSLGQMIKRTLALIPELKRLRLSSLDPVEVDPDLWHLIETEPRLMPHLHISLQAGDDMVLKRMKRRHLRQDVLEFCEKARKLRPDVAFGADIIAGFPTETQAMFLNTKHLISECDLTFLHVFPYSIRPETPAARMPQVPKAIIKNRAEILRVEGKKALSHFLNAQVGRIQSVLVEAVTDAIISGKTDQFAAISIANSSAEEPIKPGEIVKARITGYQDQNLIGDIV